MKTITLKIDDETYRKARIRAANAGKDWYHHSSRLGPVLFRPRQKKSFQDPKEPQIDKHFVRSLIIQKSGKMMKGKIMEEKIRTPENGSPIPVLHHFTPHHFTKYIPCEHANLVRNISLRVLRFRLWSIYF